MSLFSSLSRFLRPAGTPLAMVTCVACLVWLVLPAAAQQGNEGIETRPGGPVKLTGFGNWTGPEPFVRTGNEEYEQIELNPGVYTGPVEVYEFPVVLYREVELAVEDGEAVTSYEPISQPIFIPEGMSLPLLLVRWNPDAERAECEVLEISSDAVPFGTYLLVNFSNKTVGLQLGDEGQPQPVVPGSNRAIPIGVDEAQMARIELVSEVQDASGQRRLVASSLSTRTLLDPTQRSVILVADNPRHPSGVTYQLLMDFEPPAEPAAAE